MTSHLKIAAAAAFLAGGLGLASAANAAPAGPVASGLSADSLITHVAEGCGPGYFRGRRGFCRPMRGYGPRGFYGPPRYYGRRCWVRPTPFGPRRVCR